MAREGRKPAYWLWGVLFISVIGGIFWFYHSNFSTRSIKFAIAQTGTINHEHKVMAVFANQEQPISVPFSGSVQILGEDGQRFKRGESVAILQPEGAVPGTKQENVQNRTISAPKGGLFFHQTDGLENIITTDSLISMDLDKLLIQPANTNIPEANGQGANVQEDYVQAGGFIGKIVNNLIPTRAFLEITNIGELTVGKTIRLTVGEQTVNAKILRKSEKPVGVVVEFPHYIDGTAINRRQEITWVYKPPCSGVLVPKSALWTQGEELGVFLWSEGVVEFKRVKVLDQDDSQACIENLTTGVPVVITPRDGLEGLAADVKNI